VNRDELEKLLSEVESDRVERTVSLGDSDKCCEAICAFANDMPNHRRPGYLFVGATAEGRASGRAITDQILQNLAALRSDGNIQPIPVMNVQQWNLGGGAIAVVEVFPSDLPPVRYKGRVCIRVGPTQRIASEAEERILSERRAALSKTWDARPCREASIEDLALDLFTLNYLPQAVAREALEANRRTREEQLAALRFLDPRLGCPTNAALLLFAKDPLEFVPGAYVQYVRYAGTSQADDPLEDRRFSGDLLTVLRGLDLLAQEVAVARPLADPGPVEKTVFAYPPKAMHEILVNAVIHRNYENSNAPVSLNHFVDRFEILSPGGLYGDLRPEDFPRVTAYRNPVLAEAARALGFVNRYGRGVAIARAELERNESPPPDFRPEPNHFLVIVHRRP
jgi:ATP-dependent DNA helicase RecG